MSTDRGKLGSFLQEVIDWRWDDFVRAEKSPDYTGVQAAVFALIRTCSDGKLNPIKLAIDRVDGKLETPIKVEYPKIYFQYPYATGIAAGPGPQSEALPEGPSESTALLVQELPEAEAEEPPVNIATLSLRQMVNKMADQPRQLIPLILGMKRHVESKIDAGEDIQDGEMVENKVPLVKSVIAANLLNLAIEKNNFEAITEVFDQIDGKLVDTIRVLGDDVYLEQFALVAPAGAVKNEKGVYQLEMPLISDLWKQKLKKN